MTTPSTTPSTMPEISPEAVATTGSGATAVAVGHLPAERADLLQALRTHRHFLRFTVRELTDEQSSQRSTVSELTLAGLIKHVSLTERNWIAFAKEGTEALAGLPEGGPDPDTIKSWEDGFRMLPGETLQGLLDQYEQVAAATDELVATVPDLDVSYPLPEAPWFEPGARWSIRRVLLHVIAETAQHAGHADIIRESLDGQKTMG